MEALERAARSMTPLPTDDHRLVERMYRLRTVSLALSSLLIAAPLLERGAGFTSWMALLFYGWVWPHLAALRARRHPNPRQAEWQHLHLDSLLGGAWIAWMHFALLPGVALFTMLAMDKLSVGGWRLFLRGCLATAIGVLGTGALTGFAIGQTWSPMVIYACIPVLVIYPLAVSATNHALLATVQKQNLQLAELSRSDSLTQLLNRRHWEELLAREMDRYRRGGPPATLLMIDIDHFKQINDLYGHVAGDSVLRRLGTVLRESIRSIDAAGRYGGDEFGVLLTATRVDEAMIVANRIRHKVAISEFDIGLSAGCTISIGAAELGRDMEVTRDWIMKADAALYRAKQDGRNQAVSPVAA